MNVIPDAVQEVSVQAGGYTAEFGNANAGIVSSEFKTGTNNYHFSLRSETDNFGNYPGEKFLGTYSYGYFSNVFTVSGPTFTDKLKFFLSGENTFSRDNPKFFSANPKQFSDGALWDTTKIFDTGVLGGDKNEYQILKWGDANLPGNMNNRYTANGTLLFDNNPLFLRLAGAYSRTKSQAMNNVINLFNTDRLAMTDVSTLLLNLKRNIPSRFQFIY